MEKYYLMPCERQNQKSFGCKAVVEVRDDGTKVLYSYMTKIAKITTSGSFVRLCDHEAKCSSLTTMRHIVAFRVSNGLPKISRKEMRRSTAVLSFTKKVMPSSGLNAKGCIR